MPHHASIVSAGGASGGAASIAQLRARRGSIAGSESIGNPSVLPSEAAGLYPEVGSMGVHVGQEGYSAASAANGMFGGETIRATTSDADGATVSLPMDGGGLHVSRLHAVGKASSSGQHSEVSPQGVPRSANISASVEAFPKVGRLANFNGNQCYITLKQPIENPNVNGAKDCEGDTPSKRRRTEQ